MASLLDDESSFQRSATVVRAVACETCDRLLVDYKFSVRRYTDEVLRSLGAPGSESWLGASRLRQACECALDALMEHRHVEHNGGFRNPARHSLSKTRQPR
jgi:hypothetical protein